MIAPHARRPAPELFTDAVAAVDRLQQLYDGAVIPLPPAFPR